MVEIWARKDEPETADLRRLLHAAEILQNDPSSPTHLRAFAWHLAVETHAAVGWDLPADVSLASCRAAAASLSHSASLLGEEIAEQVHGIASPVLLLGAFAASRSVFGRWDILPASGALLVSLDLEEEGRSDWPDVSDIHGIRWVAPGKLRKIYEKHASPTTLNGDQVLVPRPELVAARSTFRALRPEDPETLLFCSAAIAAASSGRWPDVLRISKSLGHGYAPLEAAVQLGIEDRLGLEVSTAQRTMLALRRLFRR
jgi:hypothetical protein